MAQQWQNWWKQARHDLEHASAARGEGRHDWACFAAQDAWAERAAKRRAASIAHG